MLLRYPVILSFENHCSVEQQKVMATHLKNILGGIINLKQVTLLISLNYWNSFTLLFIVLYSVTFS